MSFDPDAAADPASGLFGLDPDPREAGVHVIAVPFDATASYRKGAWRGPAAVLRASHQVELLDLEHGRPYEAGICYVADDGAVEAANREATALADRVIAAGGRVEGDAELSEALVKVNAIGTRVNGIVRERAERALDEDKLPVVLGGDHSVPFGAIEACAERHPRMGILHFDAHADLRAAFEGFTWSHASIMENVLRRIPAVAQLVQVGIRDVGAAEMDAIRGSDGRVYALFDRDWSRAKLTGADMRSMVRDHLALLPPEVWVSFDVDGLDPTLCPNTGTPVPGGLDWGEVGLWLEELVASGRRVVGLDLNEVNPGDGEAHGDTWDAIVGARLLYRLIGAALRTRGA